MIQLVTINIVGLKFSFSLLKINLLFTAVYDTNELQILVTKKVTIISRITYIQKNKISLTQKTCSIST